MMTDGERTTVTRALFSVGLGVSVLGGLLFYGIKALLIAHGFANSGGDTPVILVGGSLTFKAGDPADSTFVWQQNSSTEFHISPKYSIASIGVKAKAGIDDPESPAPDDGDPSSDLLSLVIAGDSWQIDEYAIPLDPTTGKPNGPERLAVSMTQRGTAIFLDLKDQGGSLCFLGNKSKRVGYSPTTTCPYKPDPPGYLFSKVNLTIMNSGQTQATGTLSCIDQNAMQGKCRVVFRGPPS